MHDVVFIGVFAVFGFAAFGYVRLCEWVTRDGDTTSRSSTTAVERR